MQQAIVAGGCFWCIEAPMQRLKGVNSATSGYMGGKINNPSYQQICTGTTGHAEVVIITFDATLISYQQILQVFFALHDPTMLNQQGNDRGTQYRSAIFYQNEQQLKLAKQEITGQTESGEYSAAIVTTLEPEQEFYIADEVHQHYYDKNPYQPYCQIMIAPKLAKLESLFRDKVK
ncbi:peptide-methionine (S)-S-oxide reductase MsrA [Thalassotalea psychrophila]|uniref:Peptide methionine sulfoxide reductase MsrA n=1 Tax=Thalassotalea psychrophila TaxID=3065647 RepID=A0ABY9TZI4_9GAMM|nr:peptide-methionine (S)-S-oxide reductase MsrA [Colwelliaceae bacterium SQ149]